jgi:hypothetical protein
MLPKALTEAGYLTFQTGKLWNATYKDVGFSHGMTGSQGRHGGDGLSIGRKGMKLFAREAIRAFLFGFPENGR